MKKRYIVGGVAGVLGFVLACILVVALFVCSIFATNTLLTGLMENLNSACRGQTFSSPEEALSALEAEHRKEYDESLDYCPPYELVHAFDCEENTIIFYSYCDTYDGEPSTTSYAIRILKHNNDGTLSFDTGFTSFSLYEPKKQPSDYFFTNIKTPKGKKSISFLYLPKDSDKDIYVDGIKTEKILVSTEDQEFYVCYAISKPDTFMSSLFTPISKRHIVEIK